MNKFSASLASLSFPLGLQTCRLPMKCQPIAVSSGFSYTLTSQGPELYYKTPISTQSLTDSLLVLPGSFFRYVWKVLVIENQTKPTEKSLFRQISPASTLFFCMILQPWSRYSKRLKTKRFFKILLSWLKAYQTLTSKRLFIILPNFESMNIHTFYSGNINGIFNKIFDFRVLWRNH